MRADPGTPRDNIYSRERQQEVVVRKPRTEIPEENSAANTLAWTFSLHTSKKYISSVFKTHRLKPCLVVKSMLLLQSARVLFPVPMSCGS